MTKEIPLNRGMVAIVDNEDYPELCKFKWRAIRQRHTFGAYRGQRGEAMHRQIMGARKGQIVDHWDGNGLNNTRANLRFATFSENQFNKRTSVGKAIKFKGVYWHKLNNRYCAQFRGQGKRHWLGYFEDPIEAAKAYDAKARSLAGEFAATNFPIEGERGAICVCERKTA